MVKEPGATSTKTRVKRPPLSLADAANKRVNKAVRAIEFVGKLNVYGAIPADKITSIKSVFERSVISAINALSTTPKKATDTFAY